MRLGTHALGGEDGPDLEYENVVGVRRCGFAWRNVGHSPFRGLSRLAKYTAKVRALVALYFRTGRFPANRRRHVKQVDIRHLVSPQPSRSCTMYLGLVSSALTPDGVHHAKPLHISHVPIYKMLKVVTANGSMDCVDVPRVIDLLDVLDQLWRRVGRESGKRRLLPQPGDQIQLIADIVSSVLS